MEFTLNRAQATALATSNPLRPVFLVHNRTFSSFQPLHADLLAGAQGPLRAWPTLAFDVEALEQKSH
jgi:hypothetical protein